MVVEVRGARTKCGAARGAGENAAAAADVDTVAGAAAAGAAAAAVAGAPVAEATAASTAANGATAPGAAAPGPAAAGAAGAAAGATAAEVVGVNGLTVSAEIMLEAEAMLPPFVLAALERVTPELRRIAAAYEKSSEAVSNTEAMIDVLSKEPALMWELEAPSETVGVSPWNRGGIGLVVSKCFEVAMKHLRSGYSYRKACDGAYAESGPIHPKIMKMASEFNQRMSDTQPELPPLARLALQSLGNGHTNGFLRLSNGKAACDYHDMAPSGTLDPDFLKVGRPGLKEGLEKGIRWSVIHTAVFNRVPVLREMIITALNNKSHQEVGEVEGMIAMSRRRDAQASAGHKPDYIQCLSAGLTTEPFWSPWASCLLEVVKFTPTASLMGVAAAATALAPKSDGGAMQHLGHTFMSKLAAFKTPGLKQPVRVRIACLLANCLSPPDQVDSGRLSIITPSDLASLCSKKMMRKTMDAEAVLDKARELCDEHRVPAFAQHKMLGNLDNRMVCHLLNKGKKSIDGKDYVSWYHICQEFLEELQQNVGVVVNNPWLPLEEEEAEEGDGLGSETAAAAAPAALTMSNLKDPSYALRQLGFDIGTMIRRKKAKGDPTESDEEFEKDVYKIIGMSDEGVSCKLVHTDKSEVFEMTFAHEDISTKWQKTSYKEHTVVNFKGMEPVDNPVWNASVLQGATLLALRTLYSRTELDRSSNFEATDKPKSLKCTLGSFRKGALVLVPCSKGVYVRKHGDPLPAGSVDLGDYDVMDGKTMSVSVTGSFVYNGTAEKNWVCPFWVVRRIKANDEESDPPNMEIEVKEMPVWGGPGAPVWTFTVPVMKNTRKIQAGDEVTVAEFDADTFKGVKRIAPSNSDAAAAKKGRTA